MNKTQNEIWKDIEGYNGKYQVSNMGRFKSLNYNNTGMEMVLNLKPNRFTGYVGSTIGYVHRLVLMTFNPIDNMEEYQCDHINSIRDDNRLENLRWVSRSENNSTKHSRYMRSKNNKHTSHKSEYIKGVFEDGSIDYFLDIIDASNRIGCSTTLVVNALKTDRQWRAKGWKLEYISKDAEECSKFKEEVKRNKEMKMLLKSKPKLEQKLEKWKKHYAKNPTNANIQNIKKIEEKLKLISKFESGLE